MERFTPQQRAIWLQPWLLRRNQGEGLGLALMLVGTALPVLLLAWTRADAAASLLPALGLVWLVVLWWAQVGALTRQNQPRLAQLLPGHVVALRRQLLTQGAVATLLAAACLHGAAGPGPWVLLAALGVTLLAWLVCEPLLWLPVSFLPLLWPQGLRLRDALDGPLSLQALLLILCVLLLAACIGHNGAALRRRHAKLQAWQAAAKAAREGRTPSAQSAWVRRLEALFSWPQTLHLATLSRRPHAGNVLARLDHVLSREGHWTSQMWILSIFLTCLVVTICLLQFGLASPPPWDQIGQGARFGMAVGPFSLLLSAPLGRARMLWGSRREQTLLALLPGVPQGAQQAQALARRWGLQHLALWALGSALMLGLLALSHPASLVFAAAYSACCLPLGLLHVLALRRRPATAPSQAQRLWPFLPLLLALPAFGAEQVGLPPALSLGAAALLTMAGAWALWPGLRSALLPVGRFAGTAPASDAAAV